MIPVEEIADHGDEAVRRLLHQERRLDHTTMQGVARIMGERAQLIEDELRRLIVECYLDTAIGDALDQWGALVSEARAGLGDDAYRLVIRARIASNRSQGQAPSLLRILELLTGASYIELLEQYPASLTLAYVVTAGLGSAHHDRIVRLIERAIAAGVDLGYLAEALPSYLQFDVEGRGLDEGTMAEVISG